MAGGVESQNYKSQCSRWHCCQVCLWFTYKLREVAGSLGYDFFLHPVHPTCLNAGGIQSQLTTFPHVLCCLLQLNQSIEQCLMPGCVAVILSPPKPRTRNPPLLLMTLFYKNFGTAWHTSHERRSQPRRFPSLSPIFFLPVNAWLLQPLDAHIQHHAN